MAKVRKAKATRLSFDIAGPARAYVIEPAVSQRRRPQLHRPALRRSSTLYGGVPFIAHSFFYVCLTELPPWTM
jgi:hypothetical protein